MIYHAGSSFLCINGRLSYHRYHLRKLWDAQGFGAWELRTGHQVFKSGHWGDRGREGLKGQTFTVKNNTRGENVFSNHSQSHLDLQLFQPCHLPTDSHTGEAEMFGPCQVEHRQMLWMVPQSQPDLHGVWISGYVPLHIHEQEKMVSSASGWPEDHHSRCKSTGPNGKKECKALLVFYHLWLTLLAGGHGIKCTEWCWTGPCRFETG